MENSPKTKVKTKAEGCSGCSKLRKTCETLRKAVKGKDEENDKLKQKIQDLETEIARLMIETTRAQNSNLSTWDQAPSSTDLWNNNNFNGGAFQAGQPVFAPNNPDYLFTYLSGRPEDFKLSIEDLKPATSTLPLLPLPQPAFFKLKTEPDFDESDYCFEYNRASTVPVEIQNDVWREVITILDTEDEEDKDEAFNGDGSTYDSDEDVENCEVRRLKGNRKKRKMCGYSATPPPEGQCGSDQAQPKATRRSRRINGRKRNYVESTSTSSLEGGPSKKTSRKEKRGKKRGKKSKTSVPQVLITQNQNQPEASLLDSPPETVPSETEEIGEMRRGRGRGHRCRQCGSTFPTKALLHAHTLTHDLTRSRTQPYRCDVCSKTFANSTNLETHNRIHTGERPFECHICQNKFTQKTHLIVHLRLHSGVKPYECKLCNRKFTQMANWASHNRTHHQKSS